jgi:hypothetical protein
MRIKNLSIHFHGSPLPLAGQILDSLRDRAKEQPPVRYGRLTDLPQVGQLIDGEGGVFAGLLPVSPDARPAALIVPSYPALSFSGVAWGERGVDIQGATDDNDGRGNTAAMAEAGNETAQRILQLEVDGHKDWYWPARNELRLAYITAKHLFLMDDWYWSSTQSSAVTAWYQYFISGGQDDYDKSVSARVRAVRRLIL